MKIYEYAPEVWDEEQCEKLVRRTATDGLGTKYPFKGYLCSNQTGDGYGYHRYNGGHVYPDGEWYEGHNRPVPIVPDGYEIYIRPCWGHCIRKKETTSPTKETTC